MKEIIIIGSLNSSSNNISSSCNSRREITLVGKLSILASIRNKEENLIISREASNNKNLATISSLNLTFINQGLFQDKLMLI